MKSWRANDFLFLVEGNSAVFRAVRELIDDEAYWKKEDEHFLLIMKLVYRWNVRQGYRGPVRDVAIPPVDVIKQLYRNNRDPRILRMSAQDQVDFVFC